MATARQRLREAQEFLARQQGLEVPVEQPALRIGARQARSLDPELGSLESLLGNVEFERGQPVRNLLQVLGASFGIPTKRMWEIEAAKAEAEAEQLADQVRLVQQTHERLLANAERIGGMTQNPDDREQIAQLVAAAGDAFYQFQNFRNPEMRSAAAQKLFALSDRLTQLHDAAITERTKFNREFYRDEVRAQRAGLLSVDNAVVDRKLALNSILAKLDTIEDERSAEGQAILLEALETGMARYQSFGAAAAKAAANVLGGVPHPAAQVIGSIAGGIGAVLQAEGGQLSRDRVIKLLLEADKATDDYTAAFRDELVRSHLQTVEAARAYGVPAETWRAEMYDITAPYIDYYRQRYFPQGIAPGDGAQPREPTQAAPRVPSGDIRNRGRRPTR